MTPTRGNRSLLDPRRECSGWRSTPQLFLPNYASATSRSYAPSTQGSDYAGVAEAAAALAQAECHDNYEDEHAVKHHYVREALDAILADQEASISETRPVGCTIKWKKA